MNSPDPDRLCYAQIAGAAARHAQGWRLTADEEARAIAELTEAAAGRADLLAERAGTALGFGEGRPDAARYQQIAELCIAAGADQALIERWINVGRERAAAVAAIPYTGHPPGGLMLLVRATGAGDVRDSWAFTPFYLWFPGRLLVWIAARSARARFFRARTRRCAGGKFNDADGQAETGGHGREAQ
jgi:hypothetical protein